MPDASQLPDYVMNMTPGDWAIFNRLIDSREYEKAVDFLIVVHAWPRDRAEGTVARQTFRRQQMEFDT